MSKKQKILVVDDEPINIDVLTGLLKPDYALLVAKNGERAIKAARSGKPDLILLDIMMPDMDGYEVCSHLKADPETRDIPVVFITAMGEEADETRGLDAGAADYIRKPISPPILKARVKSQLLLVQHRQALQAAYAIIKSQRDRMEEELNIGRDIQMGMMPLDFPAAAKGQDFSLYARLEPAREVGGDFYDFFFLTDSVFCICVGDVSGKGVPAALFMAVTKTLIRSWVGNGESTADMLTHVNNVLSRDNENCMFVTLFVALCDVRSGKVTYTSAGHNPPYIVRRGSGLVRLDQRHGPVGGAMEGVTYRQDTVELQAGDTLLMYTDGVTEATNAAEELYSEDRLATLLGHAESIQPESLVNAIVDSVHEFEAGVEQADDVTVLAFEWRGAGAAANAAGVETRSWHKPGSTGEVIDWFDLFAATHGLDVAICRKVKLAIDDLLANVISYAWPDGEAGDIDVTLALADGKLTITLADNGIPFDPLSRETPDTTVAVDEREIGGLGIHLCLKVMDEVSYIRQENRNVVTLTTSV